MSEGLVFIVEDDEKISALVGEFLEAAGFATLRFPDARTVLDKVKALEPDAFILDVMLPAGDGQSLARSIRKVSASPILMLSALREDEDKIYALDGGADDYITKPFSGKELVARIKAQLRRAKGLNQVTPTKAVEVNDEAREVFWKGQSLGLSQSEYCIFSTMIKRPGRVYSRDALLDVLGDRSEESTDRAIDSHIKNIRKKVSQVDPSAEPICSVYGSGYRFDMPAP